MKDSPKVSVVLPVHNGEKYLVQAIESVMSQTFTDFELLMIDDGSTDASLQIMRDFERRDERIRLSTRENRGLVPTLNEMIDMARGIWIARMDADDIALPNRFERQLEWLEKTGADVCGSWVQRFGSDNRLVRLHQSDAAIKTELLFYSPFAHPSVMFRASLAKQLPYDDNWIKAEDYDLWIRAVEEGWKMTNIPEPLLLYRVHEGQVSRQAAEFQQQQGHQIRHRYWRYVFGVLGLDASNLDEGLKIFSSKAADLDMNAVDSLFSLLLDASDAPAKTIIFQHLTRLYLLIAADCPDIVSRWGKLNDSFGSGFGLATKLQLLVFRYFRIRKNTRMFRWFKILHNWRIAR